MNLGRWPRLVCCAPLALDGETAQDGGMWFGRQDCWLGVGRGGPTARGHTSVGHRPMETDRKEAMSAKGADHKVVGSALLHFHLSPCFLPRHRQLIQDVAPTSHRQALRHPFSSEAKPQTSATTNGHEWTQIQTEAYVFQFTSHSMTTGFTPFQEAKPWRNVLLVRKRKKEKAKIDKTNNPCLGDAVLTSIPTAQSRELDP